MTESFGTLLRRHRGALALTQEELARRAGLHPQEISKLERGVLRSPHGTTVEFLALALKLDARQREVFIVAARQPRPDAGAGQALVNDGQTGEGCREPVPATGRVRHWRPLVRRMLVPALIGLLAVPLVFGLTVAGARHWRPAAPPVASPSAPLTRCIAAGFHHACWATVARTDGQRAGTCHGLVPLYLREGGHTCLPGGDLVEVTCYYRGKPRVDGDGFQDHVVGEGGLGQLELLGHIPDRFVDMNGRSPSAVGLRTCLSLRLAAAH